MLTPTELAALLRAHRLRLTKRLGQHHLIDRAAIRRFVEACELSREETVVEIGAGLGALTEPLAEAAGRVVAVEVDRGLCPLLAQRMASQPNVAVDCRDILTLPDARLQDAVVAGAIPYHITSPILVWLAERRQLVRRVILLIQQEVARRLTAVPGTADYGRLSVLAQYGWQVCELFAVSRAAFFPQPDVDSACVRLTVRPQPVVAAEHEAFFFEVVKAAFSQRRKTLVNCLTGTLAGKWTRQEVESVLIRLGHPPSVRGETLSLEQFAALTHGLAKIV